METAPLFDLNERVKEWRTALRGSAAMPRDQLDELEDHLRASFAQLRGQGLPEEEAFLLAVRRIGKSESLVREFLKSNPERVVSAYFLGIFFRHKWSVLFCAAAGLLAAVGVGIFHRPPASSEAVLLIRYTGSGGVLGSPASGSGAVTPDQGGLVALSTEVQLLRSMDLAYKVVDEIGPEKILGATTAANARDQAALEVRSDLVVEPIPDSGMIRLVFSHRNRAAVQPGLLAAVNAYLNRHVEFAGQLVAADNRMAQEAEQLRSRLQLTEDQLREEPGKEGIVSLDQAKDLNSELESRIQQDLFSAESDLAERATALAENAKLIPSGTPTDLSGHNQEIAQETIRVDALRAKIKFLQGKLDEVRVRGAVVATLQEKVGDLRRQRDLEDESYRRYSTQLESSRIDAALAAGRVLNITQIQVPTLPRTDWTKTLRIMAWLSGGGIGLGIAVAFLNEWMLKRLLRRPDDAPPHFSAGTFREPVPVRDV